MENETIRGRIQTRERRLQDTGLLKALECRVIDSRGSDGQQLLTPVLLEERQLQDNVTE